MKLWVKLVLTIVVLPGCVIALLDHLNRRAFFDLDRIEIVLVGVPDKSLHLKPLVDELDRALEAYRGKSLWTLDLEDISSKIGGLNWVESHAIARSWPSTLTLKIRPYEVKALFVSRADRLIPVIREGKLLDPVAPMLAPDVALLDGHAFQTRPDLRRKAVEMLDEIPPEGTFSRKSISEVRWDAKDGFQIKMTKTGIDVKLGEDRFALKSARVGQVLEYLSDRNIHARSLDANLSKKVLVKLGSDSKDVKIE